MQIFFRSQRNSYYVRFGSKTYSLGTSDKREAQAKAKAIMRGEAYDPEVTIRLSELFDRYLDDADLAASTKASRRLAYRSLTRHWDGPADQLTPEILRGWFKTRKAKATTQNSDIGNIKACLNWAVRDKILTVNPIGTMRKPRANKRERFLTTEEVETMLGIVTEPFKTLVILGLETGARASELLAVEARHVKGDHILFPRSEAKTRRSERTIWLNERAQQIVGDLMDQRPKGKLLRNRNNVRWTKDSIRQRMEDVSRVLGWPVRVTDLRHRFAVDRLTRGQEPLIVAKLLGHSNANMIYSVYGHFCQNKQLMTNAANF